MLHLSCAVCDVPFEGRSRQSRYCSQKCKRTAANRKRARKTQRVCPGCKSEISEMHGLARYCSEACRSWVGNGHTEPRSPAVACAECGIAMAGRRIGVIYCTRKCKQRSVEKRRERDDAARYLVERERRIAYAIDYARKHPEVGQATKNRRKARKRKAGMFIVSGADWLRLCTRYRHCCAYCGAMRSLTMDHVIPISRGGRHSIGNLVPACGPCNSSKSGRFITEWKIRTGRG